MALQQFLSNRISQISRSPAFRCGQGRVTVPMPRRIPGRCPAQFVSFQKARIRVHNANFRRNFRFPPGLKAALQGPQLYFQNQLMGNTDLRKQLQDAARNYPGVTLVIQADKDVPYEDIMSVMLLARGAGIQDASLAALPRAFSK